jgi:hypothetical protein
MRRDLRRDLIRRAAGRLVTSPAAFFVSGLIDVAWLLALLIVRRARRRTD